jgi:ribose transport system permease protein
MNAADTADWRYILREQRGAIAAALLFVLIFALYVGKHSAGFNLDVVTTAANKGVLLAVVAIAQTIVVLTAGIDLSVGMVFVLANCLASHLVVGSFAQGLLGAVAVLAMGALAGLVNGLIIVVGRLQAIITTLATGTVYYGLALGLRPVPGGSVQTDIADAVTGTPLGVPSMLIVLVLVVALVWRPYRASAIGRAAYAIGSSEAAAYMSGVPIGRAKIVAYTLSGFLAALGGLLLTFVTYSGEASAVIGGTYTLNAIAAVVIGGTSLAGGAGGAIGSIFGALALRSIGDLLFVFDMDPLWQPLFQGLVLLLAVSLSALRLLQVRNRLELFR